MESIESFLGPVRRPAHGGPGTSETNSVEGMARLGRKIRCFRRSLVALARQMRLFVFCDNGRQLFKRCSPKLNAALVDFLPALK